MSLPPPGALQAGAAPAQAAPAEAVAAEGTGRALVMGALAGSVLTVTNVYTGLKTGLWDSGNLLAVLLGYSAMVAGLGGRARPSPLETNLVQTVACSMGAMPAAMGLMAAIPALGAWGREPAAWAVALWGVGLGTLGVAVAHALRERLMEQEQLPFPTGVATAELITSLHAAGAQGARQARGLWGAGAVAAALTALRDGLGWLPGAVVVPGQVGGVGAASLGLGVSLSPMLLGIGILMGVQAGLSLLLGAGVAWGGLAPVLVQRGLVEGRYEALAGWLVWPGVGLLVGAGAASLLAEGKLLRRAAGDLRLVLRQRPQGLSLRQWGWVVGTGGALLALLAGLGLGLSPLYALGALALVLPLVTVCARSAGQVDMSPASPVGQLTQVAYGMLAPQQATAGVLASAVVSGTAAHTSASLWALQAGRLLGARLQRVLGAQLAGVLLGVAVALPTYHLLVRGQAVGSEALPAPQLAQLLALGRLLESGAQGLPPGALLATGLGLGAGALLALAGRSRLGRWVPVPTALGLGFLLPAHACVALCLGALLRAAAHRWWSRAEERHAPAVAAGAIAGEGVLGLGLSLLRTLGLTGAP